jgi:hypothetical protein
VPPLEPKESDVIFLKRKYHMTSHYIDVCRVPGSQEIYRRALKLWFKKKVYPIVFQDEPVPPLNLHIDL